MPFDEKLRNRKDAIVKRWYELTAGTYPEQTAKFLCRVKDPFANPVGSSLAEGLNALFGALIGESSDEAVQKGLDDIAKVRAIQDFSASAAVGFVFLLKDAVRAELEPGADDVAGLLAFERRVDGLALKAFEAHMAWREKVFALRANELRKRTEGVLERFYARYEKKDARDAESTRITPIDQGGES